MGGSTALRGLWLVVWCWWEGGCDISELVMEAILWSGLAAADEVKSSVGVMAGGRMLLLNGLEAVELVVCD